MATAIVAVVRAAGPEPTEPDGLAACSGSGNLLNKEPETFIKMTSKTRNENTTPIPTNISSKPSPIIVFFVVWLVGGWVKSGNVRQCLLACIQIIRGAFLANPRILVNKGLGSFLNLSPRPDLLSVLLPVRLTCVDPTVVICPF